MKQYGHWCYRDDASRQEPDDVRSGHVPSLATKHFPTVHGRQVARVWLGVD